MARPNRHAIVVSSVTYNALSSLTKYRETMDDVVLKAVVAYSRELNIHNSDALQAAVVEYNKRFINKDTLNEAQ
jgi:hypothetical protein